MATETKNCDVCGSKDNRKVFENGSEYCFTPDCGFNKLKARQKSNLEIKDTSLLQGSLNGLPSRKISQEICELFGYMQGTDEYNNPVHIENYHHKVTGEILAQKLRYPNKTFAWKNASAEKECGLFGQHLWSNKYTKMIIVTEGAIDAMSYAEVTQGKYPVVSINKGAASAVNDLRKSFDFLLGFETIVLAFDNDEAGKLATQQCAELFPPGRVKIATLPMKDLNEMLVAGRIADIIRMPFSAREYRPDGIVSLSDITLEQIKKAVPRGLPLPYPKLDEMIRGLNKGRLTLVAAGSGIGKTTFMKQLGKYLLDNSTDLKIANIFLEENMLFTVQSFIALDNNCPAYKFVENPDSIPDWKIQKSLDKFKDRMTFYEHFGSLSLERLEIIVEFLVQAYKIDFIFLDHISILVSGLESSREGERKDIDRIMTALRSIVARTGVGILAAVHVKRGKDYNEGDQVSLTDLRGSGSLEQLSDVVLALERDQQGNDPNTLLLRVLKNRISGNVGQADNLVYNSDSGLLELQKGLGSLTFNAPNDDI